MKKVCRCCKKEFECHSTGDSCWCEEIPGLKLMRIMELMTKYGDCICRECLLKEQEYGTTKNW